MFYRINDKNVVNLEDVSYVAVDQNQMGMYELRIFLKQVEHYMYVLYVLEEDALVALNDLVNALDNM